MHPGQGKKCSVCCGEVQLLEDVGSFGNMSQGRPGADDDEAGRHRRDLREPQGEGVSYTTNKTCRSLKLVLKLVTAGAGVTSLITCTCSTLSGSTAICS